MLSCHCNLIYYAQYQIQVVIAGVVVTQSAFSRHGWNACDLSVWLVVARRRHLIGNWCSPSFTTTSSTMTTLTQHPNAICSASCPSLIWNCRPSREPSPVHTAREKGLSLDHGRASRAAGQRWRPGIRLLFIIIIINVLYHIISYHVIS